MNLTEFLTARIEDDEAIARDFIEFRSRVDCFTPEATDFVERFDPARVLTECEVKRRIVGLAAEATGIDMSLDDNVLSTDRDTITDPYLGDVILQALALPHADHPDYRDEWRPDA